MNLVRVYEHFGDELRKFDNEENLDSDPPLISLYVNESGNKVLKIIHP